MSDQKKRTTLNNSHTLHISSNTLLNLKYFRVCVRYTYTRYGRYIFIYIIFNAEEQQVKNE